MIHKQNTLLGRLLRINMMVTKGTTVLENMTLKMEIHGAIVEAIRKQTYVDLEKREARLPETTYRLEPIGKEGKDWWRATKITEGNPYGHDVTEADFHSVMREIIYNEHRFLLDCARIDEIISRENQNEP